MDTGPTCFAGAPRNRSSKRLGVNMPVLAVHSVVCQRPAASDGGGWRNMPNEDISRCGGRPHVHVRRGGRRVGSARLYLRNAPRAGRTWPFAVCRGGGWRECAGGRRRNALCLVRGFARLSVLSADSAGPLPPRTAAASRPPRLTRRVTDATGSRVAAADQSMDRERAARARRFAR
jgi:hypothetical protein